MEHQQTQRQRLQTLQRLRRLRFSTRPERVRPLVTFEDHERAVERFRVYEEERRRRKAEEEDKKEEERLRVEKARVEAEAEADAEAEAKARVEAEKEVVVEEERSTDVQGVEENGFASEDTDADDENDQYRYTSTGPRTPDRPTGRRKGYSDSGSRSGPASGSGSRSAKANKTRLHNLQRSPSTAGKTAYTDSDDDASSVESFTTAATTPEDSDAQSQLKPDAGRIFETPTKQPQKSTAKQRPDDTVCKSNVEPLKQPIARLPMPKRGDFATTRAVDEPVEDWYFLVRDCLQCEIAGVKCGRQIPACRQCQRRFNGNVRGYQMANNNGGSSSGSSRGGSGMYGLGDWSRPDGICADGGRDAASQCLVQRMWHCRDLMKVYDLPDQREAVLIRLESDGDDVWEGKLREAARLLDVYRTRRERRNWILPSQVARITGYPAPKTVAENDSLLKERIEAALGQNSSTNNAHGSFWSRRSSSSSSSEKANIIDIRSLKGHLDKLHMNDRYNKIDKDGNGSGSESESDVQPWWEEHLTQEEQKRKRKERRIERCRQRRVRRSRGHERNGGDGADSEPGSDDSVDSFVVRSVHLGLSS